jgi:hypothetical protein
LKHDKSTNEVILDKVEIDKDLENEFDSLLNQFKLHGNNATDVLRYIKGHKYLRPLFEKYDYCANLNRAYQGISGTLETYTTKYSEELNEIEEIDNIKTKQNRLQYQKDCLLKDCRERLHARYLSKAYGKCLENKKVLTYSHRKVGWSAPKYFLNENFSIELKTNFGFGRVSYFYTKIKYKGLDIVPFADWVDYQYAEIYEIVRYSSTHKLENESWYDAMQYVATACNISTNDENLFVQKYIVAQCETMVEGLIQ